MDFYDPESPTVDDIEEPGPEASAEEDQQESWDQLDLASVPLPSGDAPSLLPSLPPSIPPLPPIPPPPLPPLFFFPLAAHLLPTIPLPKPVDEASLDDGSFSKQAKKKKKKKKKHIEEDRSLLYYEVENPELNEKVVEEESDPASPKEGSKCQEQPSVEPAISGPAGVEIPKGEATDDEKAEPQTLAKKLLSKALENVTKGDSTSQAMTEESNSAGETPVSSPMLGKLKFSVKPSNIKVQKISFMLKNKKNSLKSEEDEKEEETANTENRSTLEETSQPARFKKSKAELFRPDQELDSAVRQDHLLMHSQFMITAALQQKGATSSLMEKTGKASASAQDTEEKQEDVESIQKGKDKDNVRDKRESRKEATRINKDTKENRKDRDIEYAKDDDSNDGKSKIKCNESMQEDTAIDEKSNNNAEKSDDKENSEDRETSDMTASSIAVPVSSITTEAKSALADISELYKDVLDEDKTESENRSGGVSEDDSNKNISAAVTRNTQERDDQSKETSDKHNKSKKDKHKSPDHTDKDIHDKDKTKSDAKKTEEDADSKKHNRNRSESKEREKRKNERESSRRRNRSRSDSRDRRHRRRSRSDSRDRFHYEKARSKSRERYRRRNSSSPEYERRKRRSRSNSRDRYTRLKRDRGSSSEGSQNSPKRRRRSRSTSRKKEMNTLQRNQSKVEERSNKEDSQAVIEKVSDTKEVTSSTNIDGEKGGNEKVNKGRSASSERTEFPVEELKVPSCSASAETVVFPVAQQEDSSVSISERIELQVTESKQNNCETTASHDGEGKQTCPGEPGDQLPRDEQLMGSAAAAEQNSNPENESKFGPHKTVDDSDKMQICMQSADCDSSDILKKSEGQVKDTNTQDAERGAMMEQQSKNDDSFPIKTLENLGDEEMPLETDSRVGRDRVSEDIRGFLAMKHDSEITKKGDDSDGERYSKQKDEGKKSDSRDQEEGSINDSRDTESKSWRKDRSVSKDRETKSNKKGRHDSRDRDTKQKKKDRSHSRDKKTRSRKKDRRSSRDRESRSRKKGRSDSRDKEARLRKPDRSNSKDKKKKKSKKKERSDSKVKETRSKKKERSESKNKETRSKKKERSDSKEETRSKKKGRSDSKNKETRSRKKKRSHSKDKERSKKKDRSDSRDKETRSWKKDSWDRENRSLKKDRSITSDSDSENDRHVIRDKDRLKKKSLSDSQEKWLKDRSGSESSDQDRGKDKERQSKRFERSDNRDRERPRKRSDSQNDSWLRNSYRDKEGRSHRKDRSESSESSEDENPSSKKGKKLRRGGQIESSHQEDKNSSKDKKSGRDQAQGDSDTDRKRGRSQYEKPGHGYSSSSSEDSPERTHRRQRSRSLSFSRRSSNQVRKEANSEKEKLQKHVKDRSSDQSRHHDKQRLKTLDSSDEDKGSLESSSTISLGGKAKTHEKNDPKHFSSAESLTFDLKDVLLPGEVPAVESQILPNSSSTAWKKSATESATSEKSAGDVDLEHSGIAEKSKSGGRGLEKGGSDMDIDESDSEGGKIMSCSQTEQTDVQHRTSAVSSSESHERISYCQAGTEELVTERKVVEKIIFSVTSSLNTSEEPNDEHAELFLPQEIREAEIMAVLHGAMDKTKDKPDSAETENLETPVTLLDRETQDSVDITKRNDIEGDIVICNNFVENKKLDCLETEDNTNSTAVEEDDEHSKKIEENENSKAVEEDDEHSKKMEENENSKAVEEDDEHSKKMEENKNSTAVEEDDEHSKKMEENKNSTAVEEDEEHSKKMEEGEVEDETSPESNKPRGRLFNFKSVPLWELDKEEEQARRSRLVPAVQLLGPASKIQSLGLGLDYGSTSEEEESEGGQNKSTLTERPQKKQEASLEICKNQEDLKADDAVISSDLTSEKDLSASDLPTKEHSLKSRWEEDEAIRMPKEPCQASLYGKEVPNENFHSESDHGEQRRPKRKSGVKDSSKQSAKDSSKQSAKDSSKPSSKDSSKPSSKDSSKPNLKDSSKPSLTDSSKPSLKDGSKQSSKDSSKPSSKDSSKPSSKDSSKPSSKDSSRPSSQDNSNTVKTSKESIKIKDSKKSEFCSTSSKSSKDRSRSSKETRPKSEGIKDDASGKIPLRPSASEEKTSSRKRKTLWDKPEVKCKKRSKSSGFGDEEQTSGVKRRKQSSSSSSESSSSSSESEDSSSDSTSESEEEERILKSKSRRAKPEVEHHKFSKRPQEQSSSSSSSSSSFSSSSSSSTSDSSSDSDETISREKLRRASQKQRESSPQPVPRSEAYERKISKKNAVEQTTWKLPGVSKSQSKQGRKDWAVQAGDNSLSGSDDERKYIDALLASEEHSQKKRAFRDVEDSSETLETEQDIPEKNRSERERWLCSTFITEASKLSSYHEAMKKNKTVSDHEEMTGHHFNQGEFALSSEKETSQTGIDRVSAPGLKEDISVWQSMTVAFPPKTPEQPRKFRPDSDKSNEVSSSSHQEDDSIVETKAGLTYEEREAASLHSVSESDIHAEASSTSLETDECFAPPEQSESSSEDENAWFSDRNQGQEDSDQGLENYIQWSQRQTFDLTVDEMDLVSQRLTKEETNGQESMISSTQTASCYALPVSDKVSFNIQISQSETQGGLYSPSALSPASDTELLQSNGDTDSNKEVQSTTEHISVCDVAMDTEQLSHGKQDNWKLGTFMDSTTESQLHVSSTTEHFEQKVDKECKDVEMFDERPIKVSDHSPESNTDYSNEKTRESGVVTADSTTSSVISKPTLAQDERGSDAVSVVKTEVHAHVTPTATSPRGKTGRFGTASWSSGMKRRDWGLRPPIETVVAVRSKSSPSKMTAALSVLSKPESKEQVSDSFDIPVSSIPIPGEVHPFETEKEQSKPGLDGEEQFKHGEKPSSSHLSTGVCGDTSCLPSVETSAVLETSSASGSTLGAISLSVTASKSNTVLLKEPPIVEAAGTSTTIAASEFLVTPLSMQTESKVTKPSISFSLQSPQSQLHKPGFKPKVGKIQIVLGRKTVPLQESPLAAASDEDDTMTCTPPEEATGWAMVSESVTNTSDITPTAIHVQVPVPSTLKSQVSASVLVPVQTSRITSLVSLDSASAQCPVLAPVQAAVAAHVPSDPSLVPGSVPSIDASTDAASFGFPVTVLTGTRKHDEAEPSEMIWPECRAVAIKEECEDSSSEEETSSGEEGTSSSESEAEIFNKTDMDSRQEYGRRESSRRGEDYHRHRHDSHSSRRRSEDRDRRRHYGDDIRRRREENDRRRRERERERDREREREREVERLLERERREKEREREREREKERERERDKEREVDRLLERERREREREREEERRRRRRSSRSRSISPSKIRARDHSRSPDRRRPRDRDSDRARDRSPVSPDRSRRRLSDQQRSRSPDRPRLRSPERCRSPDRGPQDHSASFDGTSPDKNRNADARGDKNHDKNTEGLSGLTEEGEKRCLDRGRSPVRNCSPTRHRDDSIDRYRDLSNREKRQYGYDRSLSLSKVQELVKVKIEAPDETADMSRLGLGGKETQSMPLAPKEFFHPPVGDHPHRTQQQPQNFTPAVTSFSHHTQEPQTSWTAGNYPAHADPATVQLAQHHYQTMGYPADQALALALQYLSPSASALAQATESHTQHLPPHFQQPPHQRPQPSSLHAQQQHPLSQLPLHHQVTPSHSLPPHQLLPHPSVLPPHPSTQHMFAGDSSCPKHFPSGHNEYIPGHPPPGEFPPHPSSQIPYGVETYATGSAPAAEAQIPYESLAEMEAHLQAEMHPDLREAALFGDLPSTRRPKSSKKQREAALRRDSASKDLIKTKIKEVVSIERKEPEPEFHTSTNAEPDFELGNVVPAESENGQSHSEVAMSQPELQTDDNSLLKVGEDVVSSTNSAEVLHLKEDQPSSTEFRPLKVKSRWRRNSEAEATSSTPPPPLSKRLLRESQEEAERDSRKMAEEEEAAEQTGKETVPADHLASKRMRLELDAEPQSQEKEAESGDDYPVFEVITENIHLTPRKRIKSMKRMVCDCTTSKSDHARGIPACGEDCLNRMLMIECGSRCPCMDYCTNKRFQKKQYAKTAPFNCGPGKGWGLKACEDLPDVGTFVMEYVGELLDYREFVRRTRRYAKRGMQHHYFMALNADELIDATQRGSNSRFLNHSCDPNCETVKWTVNGELRVGFFTKKPVKEGDELTFDYQFEFYGEPQKCYCGTEKCRGFIGGQKNSPVVRKRKYKSVERRRVVLFEDEMLDEDMQSLTSQKEGMKNKGQVLELCRLMVRAVKPDHRMALLKVIQETTEINCLRLFLGYQGLPLLWSWMVDIDMGEDMEEERTLRTTILEVLKMLPITNRTILKESKIMQIVEKWANLYHPPPLPEANSNAEPLPLPVPPDRPVVSILALHKDTSKDQKAGKKKVTFADEAASSDSDLSDSLKVSSTDDDTGAGATKADTIGSGGEAKVVGKNANKDAAGDEAVQAGVEPDPKAILSVETGDGVARKSDNVQTDIADRLDSVQNAGGSDQMQTDSLDTSSTAQIEQADKTEDRPTDKTNELDSKQTGTPEEQPPEIRSEGPMTRHRASRRPSVIPSPKPRRKGRRCLSAEKEKEEAAESQSIKEEMGTKVIKDDEEEATDTSQDSDNGIATSTREAKEETSQENEPGIDLSFSDLLKEAVGTSSKTVPPEPQKTVDDHNVKNSELSEESVSLSSESDSADSDFATSVVVPSASASGSKRQEGEVYEQLPHEATYMEVSTEIDEISSLAAGLLSGWSELKELYKIPKKQRAEERKRTERELDSAVVKQPEMKEPDPYAKWKRKKVEKSKKKDTEEEEQKKRSQATAGPKISKEVRRQLFEAKVKAEDELNAERQRQQEELLRQQQAAAALFFQQNPALAALHALGVDAAVLMGQGQAMDPSMQQSGGGLTPEQQQALMMALQAAGGDITLLAQHLMNQPGLFPPSHQTPQDPYQQQMQGVYPSPSGSQPYQDPSLLQQQQEQLALQQLALQQMVASGATVQQPGLPSEEDVPPPPSPPEPREMLPLHWKMARDNEGRVYYYHVHTRATQWEPPQWDNPFTEDMDFEKDPEPEVVEEAQKKTTTAPADTSSEAAKKIKEQFRKQMSHHVVVFLNPYRRLDCKQGRILNTDDFKHLARKLTHHVMAKELKHCRHVEDLEVNENVKAKAKDYVRKYMTRFGPIYKKSASPDDYAG